MTGTETVEENLNGERTTFFQLRVDPGFTDRLNEVIRAERDLPSKSEMLRRLVERAYRQVERR